MSCGTAKDLIKLVREQMGDNCTPYRNDDPFIMARINLAMLTLYAIRPDAAEQKIVKIKLSNSKTQQLPENSTMIEFLGTAYKDGESFVSCEAKPTEASDDFLAAYASRKCVKPAQKSTATPTVESKCDNYAIKSFSYEQKNGRTIIIDPAPPAGVDVYADVLVSQCPTCTPQSIDEQLPCKYYAAIYEKTMAYMYDSESEDAANANNAQRHSQNFAALIGQQYQTDSRIGSGYYLGAKPDGGSDPQVRRG